MICDHTPEWHESTFDDECENCGRSMFGRFADSSARAECQACADDLKLLQAAGKLRFEEYTLTVVKYSGEPRTRNVDA